MHGWRWRFTRVSLWIIALFAGWFLLGDGITTAAVRIAQSQGGGANVSDEAYDAGTWDGVTTIAPSKNAVRDKIETLAGGHDAVTLDVDAAVLLDLTTQEIGLDTQVANCVVAGPASGAANEPTCRTVVDDDIPDTITLTNLTQVTTRSHTALTDIGTNTHAQIDTHIADTTNPHATNALGTNLSSSTNDILSNTAAGSILFGGTGNTNNETLLWDFETTPNEAGVSSPTGITLIDFGTIDINAGDVSVTAVDDGRLTLTPATALESEWSIGPNHDSGGDDDDPLEIRQAAAVGTDVRISIAAVTGDATWIAGGYVDAALCDGSPTTATVTVASTCANSGLFYNGDNDVIEFDLPAAAAGKAFCFHAGTFAQVITVDPDASDTITLNGVAASAGEAIVSSGVVGEFLCVHGSAAGNWMSWGSQGTWAEETP